MFCPSCGSDQSGQYCRSCGADLRAVRLAVERQETLTASTRSAREEIGRAVADKIRETKSWKDLSKVVEGVLPELEKFLETPEEKRLRRIRSGTITATIGLGVALAFFALGAFTKDEGLLFVAGAGLVTFLLGLGLTLNGWYFTVPQQAASAQITELLATAEPMPTAAERSFPTSVTEHTTHQLPDPLHVRKAKLE